MIEFIFALAYTFSWVPKTLLSIFAFFVLYNIYRDYTTTN